MTTSVTVPETHILGNQSPEGVGLHKKILVITWSCVHKGSIAAASLHALQAFENVH